MIFPYFHAVSVFYCLLGRKTLTMKHFRFSAGSGILGVCFLVLSVSCDRYDAFFVNGRPRRDTGRGAPGDGIVMPGPDTSLLISAVRYADDYNWMKDSLHGDVPFEIVLYDDFEPVLVIEAGPGRPFSPSADTHHIVSGDLYTEYSTPAGTQLCRNGSELFRFDSREKLCGLLPFGGDLYILSVVSGSEGFVFRKNRDVLLTRSLGSVFGGFGEPSYGDTGALYLDGGVPCFSYREENKVYVVRDGEETACLQEGDDAGRVLDIKSIRGETAAVCSETAGKKLSSAWLWGKSSGLAVAGCNVSEGQGYSAVVRTGRLPAIRMLAPLVGRVYWTPLESHVVRDADPGVVTVFSAGAGYGIFRDCLLPSVSCAACSPGGRLAVAMASMDGDIHPVWDTVAGRSLMEFHGYPTCVSFHVSHPS